MPGVGRIASWSGDEAEETDRSIGHFMIDDKVVGEGDGRHHIQIGPGPGRRGQRVGGELQFVSAVRLGVEMNQHRLFDEGLDPVELGRSARRNEHPSKTDSQGTTHQNGPEPGACEAQSK